MSKMVVIIHNSRGEFGAKTFSPETGDVVALSEEKSVIKGSGKEQSGKEQSGSKGSVTKGAVATIIEPSLEIEPSIEQMVSMVRAASRAEVTGEDDAWEQDVQVWTVQELWQWWTELNARGPEALESVEIPDFLPLTLDLPAPFPWAGEKVYQACRDVAGLRLQVRQWGYATLDGTDSIPKDVSQDTPRLWTPPGDGNELGSPERDRGKSSMGSEGVGVGRYWLPIIWTRKGPLYGEVIGQCGRSWANNAQGEMPLDSFRQPVHCSDALRQGLYALAFRLLHGLDALPATYLMQFWVLRSAGVSDVSAQGGGMSLDLGEWEQAWESERERLAQKPAPAICFDRLWPFPIAPAIASVGVQQPDLFACHWRCVTGQPIREITIYPSSSVD